MKFLFYKILASFLFTAYCLLPIAHCFSQPINWDSVRQAYFDKFQPTDTPAWLFPIIFKSGDGQRDTVYIGYDPLAYDVTQPGFDGDSIFGEKKIWIDTTKFNAEVTGAPCNGMGFVCDSVLKCIILSPLEVNNGSFGCGISFGKSQYPLKMFWADSLFYNDSVPYFKDTISYLDTIPKAYGAVDCSDNNPQNYFNCVAGTFSSFILSSDPLKYFNQWHSSECIFPSPSPAPQSGPAPCHTIDSIVWYGDSFYPPDEMLIFINILPYYQGTNINNKNTYINTVFFYPNPFIESTTLKLPKTNNYDSYELILYDSIGRKIKTNKFYDSHYTLNRGELADGIYFYQLFNMNQIISSGKLIIYQP